MITANRLIYDIKNIATSGEDTINFRISNRQLFQWIIETRCLLIGQSIKRRDDISNIWIETIPNLPFTLVDKSESNGSFPVNCFILKSNVQVPQPLEVDGWDWVVTVAGLDDTEITRNNQFRAKYKKYNKFTGKRKGWYLENRYLYIINDTLLSQATVKGIWEDPQEFGTTYTPNYSWDSPFPISNGMALQLVDIVVKTKVLPFLQQFRQDRVNDDANVIYREKTDN